VPSSNSSFSKFKEPQVLLVIIFKVNEPCSGISMGSSVPPGVAAPTTWFPRSRVLALCILCTVIFLVLGFASGFGAGWTGNEKFLRTTTPCEGGLATTPASVILGAITGVNPTPEDDYTDAFN
jgi:hypothetical protein